MTSLTLRTGLVALALGGCDAGRDAAAQSAVTVKLPAARPAEPAPAFSFENSKAASATRPGPR
jgi:hypothetical protein